MDDGTKGTERTMGDDRASGAWRVEVDREDGKEATVLDVIIEAGDGSWVACVADHNVWARSGRSPRRAVAQACSNAGWGVVAIYAPGVPTHAEALAKAATDLASAVDCGAVCGTVGRQCQACLRRMFLREAERAEGERKRGADLAEGTAIDCDINAQDAQLGGDFDGETAWKDMAQTAREIRDAIWQDTPFPVDRTVAAARAQGLRDGFALAMKGGDDAALEALVAKAKDGGER